MKIKKTRSPPIGWARQHAAPQKFDEKPQQVAFSVVFSPKFDKRRPEVAGDVISGVAVDQVAIDFHVKCSDSTLNGGPIIRLACQTSFTHVCAVFNCIS